MDKCPHCNGDLGDLDPVMDELAFDKMHGEHFFNSACCDKPLRAFSAMLMYYVERTDGVGKPQMIGAA